MSLKKGDDETMKKKHLGFRKHRLQHRREVTGPLPPNIMEKGDFRRTAVPQMWRATISLDRDKRL